jgi:redox-sensitive bicupin YhaK (pirin superfamily)
VRPHPHIGPATITWLWEGCFSHRDSLGFEQDIAPGEVNWMTAGRGIVHSERTPVRLRESTRRLHGLQTWVALPRSQEERAPAFEHYAADRIPVRERAGTRLAVVAGRSFGRVPDDPEFIPAPDL